MPRVRGPKLGLDLENEGLLYPRRDRLDGENNEWTHMDPFTENIAIGYVSLNVKDGQK